MIIGNWRRRLILPRPTAWRCFVLLLMVALGTEYWNKDALPVAGTKVPWPFFMPCLLLLPLTLPAGERRWTRLLRVPSPAGPMLVFWACCGWSIIALPLSAAPDAVQFLKTFLHLTTYVVFVYVIVKGVTWPRLLLMVKAYYAMGIVAAVVSALQMLHGSLGLFPWMEAINFQSAEYAVGEGLTLGFRASSSFGEPSWAARYYVHFIALALVSWSQTRQRRHLAALALFVLGFYGANSLLGYAILCTFVLLAVLAQLWRNGLFSLGHRQKRLLGGAAYGLFLLWLVGVTPPVPNLIERSIARIGLVVQGGGSAGNRIDGVFAGLEVWRLAPILGVGLGNIDQYIEPFYRDPAYVLRSQYGSDSLYVQLLAETGIAGLAAFLWFWGTLLYFPSPPDAALAAHADAARAYGWLRFLQLDLLAQAVGMLNASDYLNPHLWTVVAIVLACKVLINRALPQHLQRQDAAVPVGPPVPTLAV